MGRKFSSVIKLTFITMSIILVLGCTKGAKDVLAKSEDATFIIYTFDEFGAPAGSGSGFFIDSKGIGITNYHVLDGAVKALIRLKNGEELTIDEIIASDKKWDIVKFSVLNKEEKKFKFLKFSSSNIEQGDKVYNLGAPIGLEQTFADGLVSSIRDDSHGKIIQVTIPISSGSSGSPILNENGEVVAVATFKSSRGENLNFGVAIDREKVESMTSNPFLKENRSFNRKENFIILNTPSDNDENLILNAIEFKDDATIAYLSYTNLDMSMNGSNIWCNIGDKENCFYIKDKRNNNKIYIVSSTLGENSENGTNVPLASVCKFKLFFPKTGKNIDVIDLKEGDNGSWAFSNIKLGDYRNTLKVDMENYQKEYAYSTMHEGEFAIATSIFEDILENDPENIQALNALGIIAYVEDNNKDAKHYFTEVINYHPNSSLVYLNRSIVYKYQGDITEAINDISKAITIDNKADYYSDRADLYIKKEKWENAISDLEKALVMPDFTNQFYAHYMLGACYSQINNKSKANQELQLAYKYAETDEMKQLVSTSYAKLNPREEYNYNHSSSNSVASYFRGSVGNFPIVLYMCAYQSGKIEGWYYYERKGSNNKLSLSGNFDDNGNIILYEFDKTGNQTGRFVGSIDENSFNGNFHAVSSSQSYNFVLYQY